MRIVHRSLNGPVQVFYEPSPHPGQPSNAVGLKFLVLTCEPDMWSKKKVLKAQHTQHGRGGANIQVDLRDVDTGNKITERFRTDEALEVVVVEDRSFTFLFQDGDIVTLMDPSTFEQLEVSKELFDDMKVTVQYCDGKPLSASVPQRVTCTVVEAQPHSKGLTAAPQYKRVVLHNGLTVMAPPFIEVGDQIVLNTSEDKYLERAKA
ncbi:hypothetical protein HPP92_000698 [Vanilla planifolia]|uniref:Elongation factor P n=1 Tax=Vanilla planifolia TaxID=51239 RepID=A0A835S683_VANPL|nr:hypothetical protein HPP92_000698 [Vanilla planifolia]